MLEVWLSDWTPAGVEILACKLVSPLFLAIKNSLCISAKGCKFAATDLHLILLPLLNVEFTEGLQGLLVLEAAPQLCLLRVIKNEREVS